jgi:hypothetical protein
MQFFPTSLGMAEAAFTTEERGEGSVVALSACTHARRESRYIGECGTLGVRVISLFCCKLHYLYTRKATMKVLSMSSIELCVPCLRSHAVLSMSSNVLRVN